LNPKLVPQLLVLDSVEFYVSMLLGGGERKKNKNRTLLSLKMQGTKNSSGSIMNLVSVHNASKEYVRKIMKTRMCA